MLVPDAKQVQMDCDYNHVPGWIAPFAALLFKIMTSRRLGKCFQSHGGILFVSPRLCIKSTYRTRLTEASAMEFVRRNTSIPVPKVHYAFEYKGRMYIIMQRIKGTCAANSWTSRSDESKRTILRQLKAMVEELRSLPVPVNTGVCSIDRGPIFDCRLPHQDNWGPFRSIRDFHLALSDGHDLTKLRQSDSYPQLPELASFYNEQWPHPVFTHGDLSSLNILCRGDDVVGIVDWETAGWLPPYWEYVTAWNVNPRNPFWQDEVDKFIQPLPHAREMDAVRRKYFGF